MENRKYKVLVLLDLNESFDVISNYITKLAKLIDAEFEFFSVKKPTEIITTDSQLSAMRSINRDCIETDKKIKEVIKPIIHSLGSRVKTSFAFGNIKTEIESCLNDLNPDIVVLGKRKQKTFNLIGDRIENFVSQNYKGTVLIASSDNLSLSTSFENQKMANLNKKDELVLDK